MKRYDYLIVGGGVIGLTIASVIRKRYPQKSVLLIEKEANVAEHASGRNSGVLHAGFYYSSDSLKARLTASGNKKMKEFCLAHNLAVNECGKVVVAQNASELPAIDELKRRGEPRLAVGQDEVRAKDFFGSNLFRKKVALPYDFRQILRDFWATFRTVCEERPRKFMINVYFADWTAQRSPALILHRICSRRTW